MSLIEQVVQGARDRVAKKKTLIATVLEQTIDDIAEAAPGVLDESTIQRLALQELTGFGVLQPLMDDPEVEEIWINKPDQVHYYKHGHRVLDAPLSHAQIRNLVMRLLAHSGRKVDRLTPFVDATLKDGSRLHVVIPDLTAQYWSLNIRKFGFGNAGLDALTTNGTLTASQCLELRAAMLEQKSILIAGATQAGKTTLMAALLAELKPQERLVSCEDTFELALEHDDWVALQVRPASAEGAGEIGLRELVKQSLRMRPSRLVIGEVRGAEALDMLVALNSGIPGLCTIHANSAQAALQKLLTLPLLAGENITDAFLRPAVLGAFDLVLFCQRDVQGKRRVKEILRVSDEVL